LGTFKSEINLIYKDHRVGYPIDFRLQPKRKGRQSKHKLTKTVLAKELIDEADRLGLFPRRLTREG
jgi:hypothetical protein